jgi:hypothetical protein
MTLRGLDREHDGRRDRELDLCMRLNADLDAIRSAFVRTIWTPTRGVSDPARRACADPDAPEAGSLTPLSAPVAFSIRRPAGTERRPIQTRTFGASPSRCEASRAECLREDGRQA